MAKLKKHGPNIGPLNSQDAIAREMGRLYRLCRKKQLDSIEGWRLTAILERLGKCLETHAIEKRISDIEKVLMARQTHEGAWSLIGLRASGKRARYWPC